MYLISNQVKLTMLAWNKENDQTCEEGGKYNPQ